MIVAPVLPFLALELGRFGGTCLEVHLPLSPEAALVV
jgi:hypothetical protein